MTIPAPASADIGPRNLFDKQGVADLKRLSRAETPEALAAVAQQFETLFVGMLLKSMREASLGEDTLFGSSAQQTYQGMFDQQLALQTADRGMLGIGDLMLQQLQHQSVSAPVKVEMPKVLAAVDPVDRLPNRLDAAVVSAAQMLVGVEMQTKKQVPPVNQVPSAEVGPGGLSDRDDQKLAGIASLSKAQVTGDEFLQQIWPLAVATGKRLGVAPEAIAGQAILESGWGQKTIRHGDDRSSHNLFGIKAGPNWIGETVTVTTLEYDQGVATRQRATFRAYDSHAEAFADYADFLQQRSWYQGALDQGMNIAGFAGGLQQGGYATDPQYASKISRLAEQIQQRNLSDVRG